MKTKAGVILSALMFTALPITALSADKNFSYNFFQAGYASFDVDAEGETLSGDGFQFHGSFETGRNLFLFADYERIGADESFSDPLIGSFAMDATLSTLSLGVGGAWPISPNVDFVGRAAFLKADAEVEIRSDLFGDFRESDDDNGYGLQAGLRGRATDTVELFGDVSYVKVFEESETAYQLGARFNMTPAFGVSLAYDRGDDVDGFTLAGRYNF